MPTMWFIKNGQRQDTLTGSGIEISIEEIFSIFPNEKLLYLGRNLPIIKPESPSACARNIVLQIDATGSTHERISESGLYLVSGVQPSDAEERLQTYREEL